MNAAVKQETTITKTILIEFSVGFNAFERNLLIRNKMEQLQYNEIVKAFLIKSEVGQLGSCWEDAEIEKADCIEVHYM